MALFFQWVSSFQQSFPIVDPVQELAGLLGFLYHMYLSWSLGLLEVVMVFQLLDRDTDHLLPLSVQAWFPGV